MEKEKTATRGTGSAARHGGQLAASGAPHNSHRGSREGREPSCVLGRGRSGSVPKHLLPPSKGLNPATSFPPLCLQAQTSPLLTPPSLKARRARGLPAGREKGWDPSPSIRPVAKEDAIWYSTQRSGGEAGGTGCSVVQPSWSQVSNSLLPAPSSAACRSPATHPPAPRGAAGRDGRQSPRRRRRGCSALSLPGQEGRKGDGRLSRRSRATELKAAAPLQLGDSLL